MSQSKSEKNFWQLGGTKFVELCYLVGEERTSMGKRDNKENPSDKGSEKNFLDFRLCDPMGGTVHVHFLCPFAMSMSIPGSEASDQSRPHAELPPVLHGKV